MAEDLAFARRASGLVRGLILGGSMPRSGGEYIYNSRILHPAIALGAVFTNIVAVFYWNWYIATWLGQPALELLGQYMGWDSFTEWVGTKSGLVILGLIAIIVGYLSVAFSMRPASASWPTNKVVVAPTSSPLKLQPGGRSRICGW